MSDRDSDITCKICHNEDNIKIIRLDCQHDVCDSCYVKLVDFTSQITCPYCNAKSMAIPFTVPECDKCLKKAGCHGCNTCKSNLCFTCWDDVHSFRALKTHNKIPPRERWNNEYCQVPGHEQYLRNIICVDESNNFSNPVCVKCSKLENYKSFESISQVRYRLENEVAKHIGNSDYVLNKIMKIMFDAIEYQTFLVGSEISKPIKRSAIEETVDEIAFTYNEVINMVKQVRDEKIQKVREIGEIRIEKTRTFIDDSKKMISEMSHIVNETKKIMNLDEITIVESARGQIIELIEQYSKMDVILGLNIDHELYKNINVHTEIHELLRKLVYITESNETTPVSQPTITSNNNQPVDEPVNESVIDTVHEAVNQPVDESVIEAVNQPIDQPVDESVIEAVNQPVNQPVDESVIEAVNQPIDQPVAEPVVVEAVVESVVEPIYEPVHTYIGEPIHVPVVDAVNVTISEPVHVPVVEPVSEHVVEPGNNQLALVKKNLPNYIVSTKDGYRAFHFDDKSLDALTDPEIKMRLNEIIEVHQLK